MIDTTSMLEIISIILSAIIIAWIVIKEKILYKKAKGSEPVFYIGLALFFALLDLLLHEFQESYTVPYGEAITAFNHIAMLFLSLNALLIMHRDVHKGKGY